jgi:hypothetical protein
MGAVHSHIHRLCFFAGIVCVFNHVVGGGGVAFCCQLGNCHQAANGILGLCRFVRAPHAQRVSAAPENNFFQQRDKHFFVCCTGGDFPVAFYLGVPRYYRAIKRQKVIIGLLAQRFDADGIGRDLQ